MPAGRKRSRQATVDQIRAFGHVATLIKRVMDQTGWTRQEFTDRLRISAGSTSAISDWTAGIALPGPKNRRALARSLRVPQGFFEPVEPDQQVPDQPAFTLPEPKGCQALVPVPAAPVAAIAMAREITASKREVQKMVDDILEFRAHQDGTVSLKLNTINMDAAHGTSVLRMLLEMGLVGAKPGGDRNNA